MQFMLFAWSAEGYFQKMPPAEAQAAVGAYSAFGEALRKENVLVSSNRLRPSADTTQVSIAGGKTRVLNGPYAETKEQLGGYFLIDVPDLDAALSWAARCPGAGHGTVEVRPVWTM
jgi:hypothetical protein